MEYAKDSKERVPLEHYISLYQEADPKDISRRTGISYDDEKKTFRLKLMNTVYEISWPEFRILHQEDSVGYYPLEETIPAKILILRYLLEGCFAKASGKFYTYREMPWGEVYYKQFQGRCIMRLAYGFGNKLQDFSRVMETLGAKKAADGDCSYVIEFMEGMQIKFILWEGDDEFPPSAQILFSDNFPVSFSAEDMAVVGDITIGTFKKL